MPRFIAVHTTPLTEADLSVKLFSKLPRGFHWKLTYCAFADNKFFCDWEAPDKEGLEKELKSQNVPFDAIYPVRIFDAATGKLEK